MTILGILCVLLFALCLAAAIAGFVLALTSRGRSSVRKGPEIYAEMMAERMERENRMQAPVAQAGVAYGKGIAWERRAVYTLPEVKQAIGERRYGAVLPALLGTGGLLGAIVFGGAGLALLASGNARFAGLLLLAIALYGTWMIASDYRRAKL